MIIGDPASLHFEIRWSRSDRHAALGRLAARIGGTTIWGEEPGRGIAWTWIELLETLAKSWPYLMYEEFSPRQLDYRALADLLRYGRTTDDERIYGVSDEDYVFSRRHNLAFGIDGLFLPALSLLRQGNQVWVVSPLREAICEADYVFATLSALGEHIADRLRGSNQESAKSARNLWMARDIDFQGQLSISFGNDPSLLGIVKDAKELPAFLEVAANEDIFESALFAAARMTGALPLSTRKELLEVIRGAPFSRTPYLEDVSKEARAAIHDYTTQPFQQGHELANWARQRFGMHGDSKVDARDVLTKLGVTVRICDFTSDQIDAVGCWGKRHGPAIFVNKSGRRAHDARGRRATIAHELAHVLVDRHTSLPAAEVFGGRAPPLVEKRANAFAAEFLLPRHRASRHLETYNYSLKAVTDLMDVYDVSRELAAWQVFRSDAWPRLSSELQDTIKSWTRHSAWSE